ncbi:MAG: D-alanine-D-alanine ligase [Alphaproteobacteria bacterium]|jgi:D-alanine-D-alanine ligase
MQENIVILFGGPGGEAEVSRNTAKSIETAMVDLDLTYSTLEFCPKTWVHDLISLKPTFVFIAMHGSPGEDGTVQAVLTSLQLPYNGSDMRSSTLAMDKSIAKKLFATQGLDVAKEGFISENQAIPSDLSALSVDLPAVFKPNNGGSSVGIEIVRSQNEWPAAFERLSAAQKENKTNWLVEEFIHGRELTIPVLGNKTLGVMEITSDGHNFYDYSAKYEVGGSQHIYPAPIATEVRKEAELLALKAHKSLGCTGVSRVDFRYDEEKNRLVVLEVNTLPGMTATSLVPEVANYNGISFSSLISWIIEDGKCRQKDKN